MSEKERHDGLEALYDTHWSHNWSDLPPEAERLTEEAFERIVRARELYAEEVDDGV